MDSHHLRLYYAVDAGLHSRSKSAMYVPFTSSLQKGRVRCFDIDLNAEIPTISYSKVNKNEYVDMGGRYTSQTVCTRVRPFLQD